MADKKEEKKAPEFTGIVASPFTLKKKDYVIGDKITVKDRESLDYLKKINKVK